MKFEHTDDIDISKVVDSMEFPSETWFASVTDGAWQAHLEVRGSVWVDYKGDYYDDPSDFPKGLKQIIRAGGLFSSEDVYVSDNNWFEVLVYCNGDYVGGDVVDVEPSWNSVKDLLTGFVTYYQNNGGA